MQRSGRSAASRLKRVSARQADAVFSATEFLRQLQEQPRLVGIESPANGPAVAELPLDYSPGPGLGVGGSGARKHLGGGAFAFGLLGVGE